MHPEHIKVVPGYELGSGGLRRARTCVTHTHHRTRRALEGKEAFEHIRILEMVVELVGEGKKRPIQASAHARASGVSEQDQAARIAYWQRLQKHRVNEREDRGIRANAERKGQ